MKKSLMLCVLVLTTAIAMAQPKTIVVDKIIAVVGNKIVLKSDVDNKLLDMQRQGVELPENAICYALEQDLNVKALVLQAEKDSLPITDEEVEIEIDNRIREYIQGYGGREALEKIAGKTIYQIKEDMRMPIKDQKMAKSMRDKIVNDVRVTPYEVKQFFESIPKDSLPYYETEVEIGQIIIYPKAEKEADDYAVEQLNAYRQQIESGRDMKTMASLYSDDPSAKQNGGMFELNRTEKNFDATFLQKAFTLKVGQISSPFKSAFGYHIIQLISRSGDDAVVRHILKIPPVTSIQTLQAEKKLDSIRAQIMAGNLEFGTAVNKYSDDDYAKFTGGMLQGRTGGTFLTIDQLDKDMIPALSKLEPGEYSMPYTFIDQRDRKGVKIIYLRSKTDPHRENMNDDYSKIADQTLAEKKENALGEWFNRKLSDYYIKIDSDYVQCEAMEKWVEASKKHQSIGN